MEIIKSITFLEWKNASEPSNYNQSYNVFEQAIILFVEFVISYL